MAKPRKYEGSKTRGLRIDETIDNFLKEFFTKESGVSANSFIVELITKSDEFKAFKARRAKKDTEPTLPLT